MTNHRLSVVAPTVEVMEGDLTLEQRRQRLAGSREALQGLDSELWRTGAGELGPLLGVVDDLGGACDAARVAVVGEALARGETSGGAAATTTVGWVRQWAPSMRSGGAGQLVTVAQSFTKTENAPVKVALDSGRVPVRAAAAVVAEAEKMRPLLTEGAEPHVLEGLISMAAQHGPRGCRMVRPALLAKYGLDDVLQQQQSATKRFIALSQPHDDGTGIFEYRLALDVEGKAVLEAALGPLSAPQPSKEAGPDLRPSDQRRGDALVTIVRRAVASSQTTPTTAKSQLFLTLDYEQLRRRTGAATTIGNLDAGTLLAPETIRRIACDAGVIPIVLGSSGEVLDWGRERRFFTPAQTKRLWLRDGGCTFPGCSAPPQWADAHHLVHWADGGQSDLTNAALLCERHHTVVHDRRLAGRLTDRQVAWDLRRGSYDELLRGACAPPARA